MPEIGKFRVGEFSVTEYDSLDSTNNLLKKLAAEGSHDGTAAIALTQTGGKGRLGRSFFSPEGCGLYMSVLLRRGIPVELAKLLTPLAAVAVAEALERCGSKKIGIKWVNDLYADGKKVCGILTESQISSDGSALNWAVVGIGVNLVEPPCGYPDGIKDRAGAAFDSASESLRERAAREILLSLGSRLKSLGSRKFIEDYRARSILTGREVTVLPEGIPARVKGIDSDCRLIVNTPSGERLLESGEVSLKL